MEAAFYSMTVIATLAAISVLIIRGDEVHDELTAPKQAGIRELVRDPRVQRLLIASLLFHVANAPITPVVAMYARQLGAEGGFVTKLVFSAQLVMVGAAFAAGIVGDRYGRKPIMTVGFLLLPLRIVLYGVFDSPEYFLPLGILDGVSVGIYTVVIASICADIDDGRGRFNTLVGMAFSTLALGNVVSPLAGGFILQHLGFIALFNIFASVALAGAIYFVLAMPETNSQSDDVSA